MTVLFAVTEPLDFDDDELEADELDVGEPVVGGIYVVDTKEPEEPDVLGAAELLEDWLEIDPVDDVEVKERDVEVRLEECDTEELVLFLLVDRVVELVPGTMVEFPRGTRR